MEIINIIGIYNDPDDLVKGVKKVKEEGIAIKNVFSPFPVHGLAEILGLETRMPLLTFLYGVFGASITFAFLYWTSVVSYPLKFGGKPLNSLSFIIIMFVLVIFVAVLFTFLTFFIRQKIGPGKKAVMLDPRTMDDKFAIVIEKDPAFTPEQVLKISHILKENGAVEVNEEVQPEDYKEERDE